MPLNQIAPLPRLRLYTALSHYWNVFTDLLTGKAYQGDDLERLSGKLQTMLGMQQVVPMPLARVGIYATIKALIRPGQKVIVSPYTIADVINMVVCAGGVPVFADIERETCNIDAKSVEALIGPDTGAVMVTHFYGLMCDVERIAEICAKHGVPLVEDAAQAFGGRRNGRFAGTFGTAGIYSFGMYKNVNAFFGGAVATNDPALAERIRAEIAAWPYQGLGGYAKKVISAAIIDVVTHPLVFRIFTFWLFRWAFLNNVNAINNKLKIDLDPKLSRELPADYKIRMSPLQARLILEQLDGVDAKALLRRRAAKQWHEGLKDIPELIIPPLLEDGSHIYWYFPIQYEHRHKLVAYAMQHGRDITESYHRNCAALPCFSAFANPCPNAQKTADSLIYLPTYPRYSAEEIAKTIGVIRAYFGK